MLDRVRILDIIDKAYAARTRGDKAELGTYWAPGAVYRLSGDPALVRSFPAGPADAIQTTEALVDLFQFEQLERLHAIVEGDAAAVLWRVLVSTRGGEPVTTEIYDLWKFDADGKVTSLLQFADTALIAKMLA